MKSGLATIALMTGLIAATVAPWTTAQEPGPPVRISVYSGILRSIDREARLITVVHSSVSQKFVVPTDAQIIVKDKAHADFSDLMIGDSIEVKYADDDGVYVVHQISLLGVKIP